MTGESSSSSEATAEAPPRARAVVEPAVPVVSVPPRRPGRPLIEVRDLGVWYRLHRKKRSTFKRNLLKLRFRAEREVLWALRHITFSCYEGEALGVVGPNGAGKSTLCLALAGILIPDEGAAIIRGQVTTLLTLGAGFNLALSGRANIQLYAAFLGIPRGELERRMDEIIEFSELGGFIDEPVRSYSSGMRARLGFSVASALDPEILILDEVLGAGDRAFRAKSRQRMQAMMGQSKLIVIVSHATTLLREICTHGLWLDHGLMRRCGEIDEVLDAYEQATDGIDVPPDEDGH